MGITYHLIFDRVTILWDFEKKNVLTSIKLKWNNGTQSKITYET